MYGIGLLGFRDTSFYNMDVAEFVQLVDGAMLWEMEKEDRLFSQFAVFTAQQMLATGNLKKNTDIKKLVNSLYQSYTDRMKAIGNSGKLTYVGKEKVAELRRKIQEKFK